MSSRNKEVADEKETGKRHAILPEQEDFRC
jgi:hypothetical protein